VRRRVVLEQPEYIERERWRSNIDEAAASRGCAPMRLPNKCEKEGGKRSEIFSYGRS